MLAIVLLAVFVRDVAAAEVCSALAKSACSIRIGVNETTGNQTAKGHSFCAINGTQHSSGVWYSMGTPACQVCNGGGKFFDMINSKLQCSVCQAPKTAKNTFGDDQTIYGNNMCTACEDPDPATYSCAAAHAGSDYKCGKIDRLVHIGGGKILFRSCIECPGGKFNTYLDNETDTCKRCDGENNVAHNSKGNNTEVYGADTCGPLECPQMDANNNCGNGDLDGVTIVCGRNSNDGTTCAKCTGNEYRYSNGYCFACDSSGVNLPKNSKGLSSAVYGNDKCDGLNYACQSHRCNKWETCSATTGSHDSYKCTSVPERGEDNIKLSFIGNTMSSRLPEIVKRMFGHTASSLKTATIGKNAVNNDVYDANNANNWMTDPTLRARLNEIINDNADVVLFNDFHGETHMNYGKETLLEAYEPAKQAMGEKTIEDLMEAFTAGTRVALYMPVPGIDSIQKARTGTYKINDRGEEKTGTYGNDVDELFANRTGVTLEACRYLGLACMPFGNALKESLDKGTLTVRQIMTNDKLYTAAAKYSHAATLYAALTGESPVELTGGAAEMIDGTTACNIRLNAWNAYVKFVKQEKAVCEGNPIALPSRPGRNERKCTSFVDLIDDEEKKCTAEFTKGGYVEPPKKKDDDDSTWIVVVVVVLVVLGLGGTYWVVAVYLPKRRKMQGTGEGRINLLNSEPRGQMRF